MNLFLVPIHQSTPDHRSLRLPNTADRPRSWRHTGVDLPTVELADVTRGVARRLGPGDEGEAAALVEGRPIHLAASRPACCTIRRGLLASGGERRRHG